MVDCIIDFNFDKRNTEISTTLLSTPGDGQWKVRK